MRLRWFWNQLVILEDGCGQDKARRGGVDVRQTSDKSWLPERDKRYRSQSVGEVIPKRERG